MGLGISIAILHPLTVLQRYQILKPVGFAAASTATLIFGQMIRKSDQSAEISGRL
jgi:hypothetical protein